MGDMNTVTRLMKEAQRFAALAEVSSLLYCHKQKHQVMNLVTDLLIGIVEADISMVYLMNETTGKLQLEVARGLEGDNYLRNATNEPPRIEGANLVELPLADKENYFGLLVAGRMNNPWSENDMDILALLGRLVSAAITNNQFLTNMQKGYLDIVKNFSMMVEARDQHSQGHSARVAELAVNLARIMGATEESLIDIEIAGIIHDIGKVGVPESLLNKKGKLTAKEFELVKDHTSIGADLLNTIKPFKRLIPFVQYHHERYDGSGYPEGLKGSQIPMEVQIIGIADVYEALTSVRTYRDALTPEESLALLKDSAGKWFSHELVEALEKVIYEQWDAYPSNYAYPKKFLMGGFGQRTSLTPRETEILALVSRGLTNKEIAQQLYIAERTVKSHLTSILRKLNLSDRTKAAVFAINQGLNWLSPSKTI